jgi:hypothetical protein
MTSIEVILGAQAIASGAMCGLIWFVQVVHYPLFARVGGDGSKAYAAEHQRRTTLVVGPLMLVEIATAALIALSPPAGVPASLAWAGVAAVVAIWLSTALVQIPLHARLGQDGHDDRVIAQLVGSNWARTVLWTARAVLSTWMLTAAS